ncbi:MAG TPA: HAD family acid phosphatase [Candidatus Baltobacteraceae bacterium]
MIVRRLMAMALTAGLAASFFVGSARADSCSQARAGANGCTAYDGGFPNLGVLENQILAYFTSGRYEGDASKVDNRVEAYVTQRLRQHIRRPAVVFDIDDTSLSDFPYEQQHSFGFDQKSYDAALAMGFPAIVPTMHLVQRLRGQGVAIFFITGRRTTLRAATLANLSKVGYPAPVGIYFRPVGDHAKSVIPFKSGARAAIAKRGYTILASVGDQWSDLHGGFAEQLFKLPNPMYFIP